MDSKNLTDKTKQALTPRLNLPSTKRSKGHESENEANHYVTPDNLKFSQRSALSGLTNVTQSQQISLPHNSPITHNYFYPGYQTYMPPHIGFTPLVLSPDVTISKTPVTKKGHVLAVHHNIVKKSVKLFNVRLPPASH
ncbi:uncharacterized protein G2W53_017490 [Senna tora]|uniref:Uncharacterized protein n=1 Tax=Senna tora TaxID=362788 RepID=A0A834WP11_9FABA|nr:uncharacterized protein G2W53_017490 [Senna tora]